ncbi:MAG: TIGR03619 family F420-dependent LLM class oxidoreductase [Carbonactinosporaceae bacterium]
MKIGFALPVSGSWATPDNQAHVARRAEELGYHSAWTFQRLLFPADPTSPRWLPSYRSVADPIVSLAFVAGLTSRIRLGVAVLNMPFFSPVLAAKQLGTLDIASGGRLDVGLGLGWSPQEYAAVGIPRARRGERAEEFLRQLKGLWTADIADDDGAFWQLQAVRMAPKPVQQPHPPVLLGGFAEAALRRAGRLADGWISGSGADLGALGKSVTTVRDAARSAGRDPERLRFVCRGVVRVRDGGAADRHPLTGSLQEIRGDLEQIRAQGMTELFVDLNFDPEIGSEDADPAESMRRAEEVLEALAP